jgi:tRNA(fMet)-specific endonuclease VapC
MADFLLDSNVCIDALRDPYGPVASAIADHIAAGHSLLTSSIVQYELEMGARKSTKVDSGLATIARFLADAISVKAFSTDAATHAAMLTRDTQMRGISLKAFDALIAGHAIALGATLVTSDAKLKQAVREIEVVTWR